MATRNSIATDNFNRAAPLGANWAQVGDSTVTISASTLYVSSHFSFPAGADGVARWVGAGTFTNDHYAVAAVATLTDQGGGNQGGIGVGCRISADTTPNHDYYYAIVDSDGGSGATHTLRLGKVVNGTNTDISSTTNVVSNGDTIELEAEGTALRVYLNGVQKISTTDSSLSTGVPGIVSFSNAGAGNLGDNWIGGSLTSSSGSTGSGTLRGRLSLRTPIF